MAKGEGESETDGERVERDLQRKEEEEEGYGLGWVGEGREGRRCASSTSGTAARRWQFRSFLAHWRGAAVVNSLPLALMTVEISGRGYTTSKFTR